MRWEIQYIYWDDLLQEVLIGFCVSFLPSDWSTILYVLQSSSYWKPTIQYIIQIKMVKPALTYNHWHRFEWQLASQTMTKKGHKLKLPFPQYFNNSIYKELIYIHRVIITELTQITFDKHFTKNKFLHFVKKIWLLQWWMYVILICKTIPIYISQILKYNRKLSPSKLSKMYLSKTIN